LPLGKQVQKLQALIPAYLYSKAVLKISFALGKATSDDFSSFRVVLQ